MSSCGAHARGSPGPEKDRKSKIFGSFSGSWEAPWGSEEGRKTPKGRKSLIWDRPEGLGEGPGGSKRPKNDEKVMILKVLRVWERPGGSWRPFGGSRRHLGGWIWALGVRSGPSGGRFWVENGSKCQKMTVFHQIWGSGGPLERLNGCQILDFQLQRRQRCPSGSIPEQVLGPWEGPGEVLEAKMTQKCLKMIEN